MFKRELLVTLLQERLADLGPLGSRLKTLILREAERHYTRGMQDEREAALSSHGYHLPPVTTYRVIGERGSDHHVLRIDDVTYHAGMKTVEIRVDLPAHLETIEGPIVARLHPATGRPLTLPILRKRFTGGLLVNIQPVVEAIQARMRGDRYLSTKMVYIPTPPPGAKFAVGERVIFIGENGDPRFDRLGREAIVVRDGEYNTHERVENGKRRTAVIYDAKPGKIYWALTSHLVKQLGPADTE